MRESSRSASSLTTQPRRLSPFLTDQTQPVPAPSVSQLSGCSPQCLSAEGPGTYYTPPNKAQHHQPVWEIQEPGDSPKSVWLLRGGGRAQEASPGSEAPAPRRVQARARCPLWVPVWAPELSAEIKLHNMRVVS